MSKISNKWLGTGAVNEDSIALSNNAFLKGKSAITGDINIVKVNTSDKVEFASVPQVSNDAIAGNDLVRKSQVDTALGLKLNSSEVGVSVAPLVAGKVPVANLPSAIMTYDGVWNVTTNSPSLVDGVGDQGSVYKVTGTGSHDFGSGAISFVAGDYVIYNGTVWEKSDTTDAVSSVNGQVGIITLDSDDIAEGTLNKYYTATQARSDVLTSTIASGDVTHAPTSDALHSALGLKANDNVVVKTINGHAPVAGAVTITSDEVGEGTTNLYYTTARAKNDTVVNSTAGSETDKAASVSAMKSYVTSAGATAGEQVFTLIAQNILDGYVDLSAIAKVNSILVFPVGGIIQEPTVDYTINYTGGSSGNTRVTFAGDLLALVAGDKLVIKYLV